MQLSTSGNHWLNDCGAKNSSAIPPLVGCHRSWPLDDGSTDHVLLIACTCNTCTIAKEYPLFSKTIILFLIFLLFGGTVCLFTYRE